MAVVKAALILCAVLATSHATAPKPAYMCTVKCSDITDKDKAHLG